MKQHCRACELRAAQAQAHIFQLTRPSAEEQLIGWGFWLAIVLMGALAAAKLVQMIFRVGRRNG